jgi:hypothetical protein
MPAIARSPNWSNRQDDAIITQNIDGRTSARAPDLKVIEPPAFDLAAA